MGKYERGLYEALISEDLERELARLPEQLVPSRSALREAEAGDRLALYLARLIERAVDDLPEKDRVSRGRRVALTPGASQRPAPGAAPETPPQAPTRGTGENAPPPASTRRFP